MRHLVKPITVGALAGVLGGNTLSLSIVTAITWATAYAITQL